VRGIIGGTAILHVQPDGVLVGTLTFDALGRIVAAVIALLRRGRTA